MFRFAKFRIRRHFATSSMKNLTTSVTILLIFGTLYRLWPIAVGMPSLANFFITEDGYLMLTVARNMAIGNGMSVSDGTIATNGVQPLIAFVFAGAYWLTDGAKEVSLILIHLLHAGIALITALTIRTFAARMLAPRFTEPHWPWMVALLWFLGPLLLRHSMNGLETSLITLVALSTLLAFQTILRAGSSLFRVLCLGALCGLAVLARNDAVFLVAGLFLAWAIWDVFVLRTGVVCMVLHLTPPGLVSIAVAAPWLVNNYVWFGSIVPISGTAQSLDIPIGQNLHLLPAKLFEHAFPMLPIPSGLEAALPVIWISTIAAAFILVFFAVWLVVQGTAVARCVAFGFLIYAVALAGYYGLFFGAPHFLSRYLAPISPLLILAALVASLEVGRLLRLRSGLALVYGGGGTVLAIILLSRALLPGVTVQGHEQVIAWVDANVDSDTWVGAVQTGTLGYWHDRTLNLDGKVNPQALEARKTSGSVLDYVTKSEIDVVADWVGVGDWIQHGNAGFNDAFALELQDEDQNLAILKRRGDN